MYLPLFICLSLCLSAGSQKGVDDFLMKWFGRVGYLSNTSGLDDPDHGVDSEIFNRNFYHCDIQGILFITQNSKS